MKLSRLRIRGLRSYAREVEIDLARLGEAGLFAIVGPTGSGKSTILDGIFLALFGRCPRGEPGDCVALGTLELDVRLEIEIESDEAPRALAIERRFRWTGKRGTTRQFSLQIEERMDGVWLPVDTGGRKPEDYLREEIVRVSISDFEQAVVLPQGRLDALLRARPAERRTLLTSLFRTERLGQPLFDALRAREDEARGEIDRLAEEERGSAVTPEEIEAADERVRATRADARAADEALGAVEARDRDLREAFAIRARAVDATFAGAADAARAAAIEAEAASALDRAADRGEHLRACVDRITAARAGIDEARAALDQLTSDRAERERVREPERDAARRAAIEAADQAARALAERREIDRRAARVLELRARAALLEPRMERLTKARLLVSANQLAELAAERRLEALTRDAAALLRTLSADRYGLVRADDGAFAVADSALGGAERSPATLSGGEAFLVALALALALSERIQKAGRARFDFFFLDEGLGGLDAATLEIALSALERLRGPRRVIGLISHLAAVEERMPRKLRVEPGRGERGVTVRLEIGEPPREKSPPGPRRRGMLARQDE